jgi:hypothetical protein
LVLTKLSFTKIENILGLKKSIGTRIPTLNLEDYGRVKES